MACPGATREVLGMDAAMPQARHGHGRAQGGRRGEPTQGAGAPTRGMGPKSVGPRRPEAAADAPGRAPRAGPGAASGRQVAPLARPKQGPALP
jgi:hypothetical protein